MQVPTEAGLHLVHAKSCPSTMLGEKDIQRKLIHTIDSGRSDTIVTRYGHDLGINQAVRIKTPKAIKNKLDGSGMSAS